MPLPTTIPDWAQRQASAGVLNRQNSASVSVATTLANEGIVRILYGARQVGGDLVTEVYDPSTGIVTDLVLWVMGEINAVSSTYINRAAPVTGVTANHYTGTTSQTADALLSAAIAGYADTMVADVNGTDIGLSYSVYQYDESLYPTPPDFLGILQGRKIYNPDTTVTEYSRNPSLVLRDVITSAVFGLGEGVDDTSLIECMDANEATVTTEARRLLDLLMDKPMPTLDWVRILAQYAALWPWRRGDTWHFRPDRPASTDHTLTNDHYVNRSFIWTGGGPQDIPTRVVVEYTSTLNNIEASQIADAYLSGVETGTVEERVEHVRLPGITRYSQAKREAEERLAQQQRYLSFGFQAFDVGWHYQLGDIMDLTHAYGFTNELTRIIEPPQLAAPGRFQVRVGQYSADDYSDTEASEPSWYAADDIIGSGIFLLPDAGFLTDDFSDGDLDRIHRVWNEIQTESGEESIVSTNSPVSGASIPVWRMGNNSGNDQVWKGIGRRRALQVNDGDVFKASMWVRQTAGSGASATTWGGVMGFKGDYRNGGGAIVNRNGDDLFTFGHYFCVNGETLADANWTYFEGYLTTGAAYALNAGTVDDPHILHPDVEAIVPHFIVNNNGEPGTVDLALMRLERVENYGSTFGVNARDSNDNIIEDHQGLNAYLAERKPSDRRNILFNGAFDIVSPDNPLRPLGWYVGSATSGYWTYPAVGNYSRVDAATKNRAQVSTCFRVDPEMVYRISYRARTTAGSVTNRLYVNYLESELDIQAGEYSLGNGSGESETATRTGVDTISTSIAHIAGYQIKTFEWVPGSAVIWACIQFNENDTGTSEYLLYDWVRVEEILPVVGIGSAFRWVGQDDGGGGTDWYPADNTQNLVATFKRGSTVIATRTVLGTLTTSGANDGDIGVSLVGSTGEATSNSSSGNSTPHVVTTVTHTASGQTVDLEWISQGIYPGGPSK